MCGCRASPRVPTRLCSHGDQGWGPSGAPEESLRKVTLVCDVLVFHGEDRRRPCCWDPAVLRLLERGEALDFRWRALCPPPLSAELWSGPRQWACPGLSCTPAVCAVSPPGSGSHHRLLTLRWPLTMCTESCRPRPAAEGSGGQAGVPGCLPGWEGSVCSLNVV